MAEVRSAFEGDVALGRARAAAKAAWWGAGGLAARAWVRPDSGEAPRLQSDTPPPPRAALRRAWQEAFDKEARDVGAGLYPPPDDAPPRPDKAVAALVDLLADAREVDARRRRGDGVEVRDAATDGYPAYYRQNFHFQSGGWFTDDSARRYDGQVELLFAGAAGAMRRRALSLLAQHWRGRDTRGLRVVDVACGSGAFTADLKAAFPRSRVTGLDLSAAYLGETRRRADVAVVQANAERLPFADGSLDAVTCVYLFHELPPRVRPVVAAEFARVLKPGGVLAFADSVQAEDAPEMARLLEAFPVLFHEPFYASYQSTDLPALFGAAGLELRGRDSAFMTKALLLER